MSKNTIRIVSGLIVFAMLASVVALIAVAAAGGNNDPQPATVQSVDLEDLIEDSEANQESNVAELPAQGPSGLPSFSVADLPPEAITTLTLIDSDGPFPYDKDGSRFQNREGILPDESSDYYREYTVDTPGIDHRGALRIVTGSGGEIYWTSDHYESFSQVLDWTGA